MEFRLENKWNLGEKMDFTGPYIRSECRQGDDTWQGEKSFLQAEEY